MSNYTVNSAYITPPRFKDLEVGDVFEFADCCCRAGK